MTTVRKVNGIYLVYLSGPMSDIPDHNFPAFDKHKRFLTQAGYSVISPADLTRAANASGKPHVRSDFMRRDLHVLVGSDAVAVLPGWEMSRGARCEVEVALECNIPVFHVETMLPVSQHLFDYVKDIQCPTYMQIHPVMEKV